MLKPVDWDENRVPELSLDLIEEVRDLVAETKLDIPQKIKKRAVKALEALAEEFIEQQNTMYE